MSSNLIYYLDHLGFRLPDQESRLVRRPKRAKRGMSMIYFLDHLGFKLPEDEQAIPLPEAEKKAA